MRTPHPVGQLVESTSGGLAGHPSPPSPSLSGIPWLTRETCRGVTGTSGPGPADVSSALSSPFHSKLVGYTMQEAIRTTLDFCAEKLCMPNTLRGLFVTEASPLLSFCL